MGEGVPRRMRRFQRKEENEEIELGEENDAEYGAEESEMEENIVRQTTGLPDEGNDKKKTMDLALKEVKRFKETHKRLPTKEEYDEIAENIYSQLKGEREKERVERRGARVKKHTGRDRRKGKKDEKEEELPKEPVPKPAIGTAADIKGMDIADLFGEGKKKSKVGEGELEGLSDFGGEEDEFSMEGFGDEKEKKEGCPNCKKPTELIIYCPECGAAYCPACAKKIEKAAGKTKYYCPKCGKPIEK